MLKKISLTAALIIALGSLSACATRTVDVEVVNYDFYSDLEGLTLTRNDDESIIYSRLGAVDLSTYTRFIVDPVRVDYYDPAQDELSLEDVNRMQSYLRNAMVTELTDQGYTVATRSEPNTMRIGFIISGVETPSPLPNIITVATPIIKYTLSIGEVTVEAVFTDASSNSISAVVVGSSQGARLFNASPWSTWADVEAVFDQWAEGIAGYVSRE